MKSKQISTKNRKKTVINRIRNDERVLRSSSRKRIDRSIEDEEVLVHRKLKLNEKILSCKSGNEKEKLKNQHSDEIIVFIRRKSPRVDSEQAKTNE